MQFNYYSPSSTKTGVHTLAHNYLQFDIVLLSEMKFWKVLAVSLVPLAFLSMLTLRVCCCEK